MIHVSRAVILSVMLVALLTGVADAWDRGHAERFATLPPGTAHPEGLAVDHAGNLWAADFDVSKSSGPGDVIAFRPDGALLRHLSVSGSSNLLLGLDFHPATGALLNGADGLIIDDHDNLWVCANQSDEIVVVDPTGKAIAKLGDFDGVNQRGEPIGLLFPASLVRSGDHLYVTNLSLDLKAAIGRPAIDGPWAAQVTRHTIARLPFRIPEVREPND